MKTVLIVDDDPVAIKLIGMIMARRGYAYAPAASADEALTWLGQRNPVEVIVTDQNLGGTTGLELYAKLQADIRYRSLPVVLCTGTTHWQTVSDAMKLGIKHLIVKPIAPAVVIAKVEAAAAERSPIMPARDAIKARLMLSEHEYNDLVQVWLVRLAQLRNELDQACARKNRDATLAVIEKLDEPAQLLRANRLLEAINSAPPKASWNILGAHLDLILNEVVTLESALAEEGDDQAAGAQ